jgi:hypothetical protein
MNSPRKLLGLVSMETRELATRHARRQGPSSCSAIVLNEHDRAARGRAHYLAWSTFLFVVLVVAPLAAAAIGRLRPRQWPGALLLIAAPLLILVFSLPQAILLWTEPDLDPDPVDPGSQTIYKVVP